MSATPLITVITVSYNAVDTIEETILSVIHQTYANIEYLIIDGGSTDGTTAIINKYRDRISCTISEPDRGIYDAMNKGISMASGEWVNFMNSGDLFYRADIIRLVADYLVNGDADVVYGDAIYTCSWGKMKQTAQDIGKIDRHLPFCHQSSFVKTQLLKERKYDTRYRICADYDFFYRVYRAGHKFAYVPITIAVYEAENGLSAQKFTRLKQENAAVRGIENTINWKIKFKLIQFSAFFRALVKRMLPDSVLFSYRKRRHDLLG